MAITCSFVLIQPQYLKLLLLLGVVKKVTKDATKQIRKSEDRTNNEINFLKKMYGTGQNNSFDSIAPTKRKLVQIKQTKNVFNELKKEMINFLKKVRDNQVNETKRIQTLTEMDDQPETKDFFFKTQSKLKPDPPSISLRNKSSTIAQKNSHKMLKYADSYRKTEKTKIIIMDANRLKVRIKNQSDVFKKFNSTLSKYYHVPGSDGTVKGGFELIQLYLNSLFQAKNCTAIRLRQSSNKSEFRERISFEVQSMINVNEQIYMGCKQISKTDEVVSLKFNQIQAKYQNYRSSRGSEDNSNPVIWSQFGKKINFMIEATKSIISLPSLNRIIKQKATLVGELFEKMSQFRYLSRYFCLEITNMHKNMRKIDSLSCINKQNDNEEYEKKWKKVFARKFQPLKINLRQF